MQNNLSMLDSALNNTAIRLFSSGPEMYRLVNILDAEGCYTVAGAAVHGNQMYESDDYIVLGIQNKYCPGSSEYKEIARRLNVRCLTEKSCNNDSNKARLPMVVKRPNIRLSECEEGW